MSWVAMILLSALCLGVYEVLVKGAVDQNDTFAVLFLSALSGFGFLMVIPLADGGFSQLSCPPRLWLLIAVKSMIVAASWACLYSSLRTMPISLVAPIRATSPLWTFLGGVALFGEIPSAIQAVGMAVIFAGYFLFSVWGRLEGFNWAGREMALTIIGTLLGAASSLYDKFLLGEKMGLDRSLVQFHFSLCLVPIAGLLALCTRRHAGHFSWRWSIPAAGILLIAADWFYFGTVAAAGTQIAIVALLRRCSVIVTFSLGCLLFRDTRHLGGKIVGLALILGGALLLLCRS